MAFQKNLITGTHRIYFNGYYLRSYNTGDRAALEEIFVDWEDWPISSDRFDQWHDKYCNFSGSTEWLNPSGDGGCRVAAVVCRESDDKALFIIEISRDSSGLQHHHKGAVHPDFRDTGLLTNIVKHLLNFVGHILQSDLVSGSRFSTQYDQDHMHLNSIQQGIFDSAEKTLSVRKTDAVARNVEWDRSLMHPLHLELLEEGFYDNMKVYYSWPGEEVMWNS